MIYSEVNNAAKHSRVHLACRTGGVNDQQTNLFLVHGHPLSYISRALVWDADGTYPFGIIRNNRLPLLVQVDMSSSNPHHSLSAILAVLNAQPGFQDRVKRIKFAGWESISFRGLVQLIIDCETDNHIRGILLQSKYTWSGCQSHALGTELTRFWKDVSIFAMAPPLGAPPLLDPFGYVARCLWTYLNPDPVRPTIGGPVWLARWTRQRQMRERMNSGFFSSQNVTEALQRS